MTMMSIIFTEVDYDSNVCLCFYFTYKPPPQEEKPVEPVSTKPKRCAPQRSGRAPRSPSRAPRPAPAPLTHCDVCAAAGDAANLVRCDECSKRYHFTCLEPPLNKNPKKRGYSWHCAECDPTDLDDNN